MKKTLKIAGVALLIFALVSNLQYSLFNVGTKNYSVSGPLHAEDGDEGEGGESGGEGFWVDELFFDVCCGGIEWSTTTFYGATGEIVGTTTIEGGTVTVRYTGNYSSSKTEKGTMGGTQQQGWSCPTHPWSICTPCSNPCAGC